MTMDLFRDSYKFKHADGVYKLNAEDSTLRQNLFGSCKFYNDGLAPRIKIYARYSAFIMGG